MDKAGERSVGLVQLPAGSGHGVVVGLQIRYTRNCSIGGALYADVHI